MNSARLLSRGRRLIVIAALLAVPACGGGGASGPSTTPTPTASPTANDPGTTITITAAGVSPKEITVAVGARVTFVNQDSAFHEMNSDPHPVHTDCPEINAVGALNPGTSRQTLAFTRARTCGYHDHGQSENASFQGRIVIR